MVERAPRILLVDDEQSIQTLLSYPLRKDGYEVVQADDGREALARFGEAHVRPRRARRDDAPLDGLEVCRRLRARSSVPIIMLTAKAEEIDKVARPRARRRRLHHQAVLDARVPQPREGGAAPRAAWPARRRRPTATAPLEVHELRDRPRQARVAVRGEDGADDLRRVRDPRRARHAAPAACLTRDMLLTRIWGDSAYRDPRTIDVHIRHLREKLERDPKEPGVPLHRARRRLPLPRHGRSAEATLRSLRQPPRAARSSPITLGGDRGRATSASSPALRVAPARRELRHAARGARSAYARPIARALGHAASTAARARRSSCAARPTQANARVTLLGVGARDARACRPTSRSDSTRAGRDRRPAVRRRVDAARAAGAPRRAPRPATAGASARRRCRCV